MEKDNKKKTTPLTWIVFIVVFIFAFITVYEISSGKGIGSLFESSASKKESIARECEQEAYERAKSLRESELEVLKSKSNPTKYDLEEIERLENSLKEGLVSRDDKQYLYKECMKLYGY